MSVSTPVTAARPHWHSLPPTTHRAAWVSLGLFVQLIAIAGPLAWIAERTKKVDGVISKSTLLVVGRSVMHTHQGVLVLIGGAVVFALGSVALARPYVRSLGTLLVAVPLAAIVGVLLLGAIALIVALIVFIVWANVDLPGGGGGASSRKKDEKPARHSAAGTSG